MEGVGARLGRSSTRYGPATVFTGPVRKWKKKWVHVSPSATTANHSHPHNGTANGNNGSRVLLYRWTPMSQSSNNGANGESKIAADDADGAAAHSSEEQPRRRFKYVPTAVVEEQKIEATEEIDDEAKSIDINPSEGDTPAKNNGFDEKPDINDAPMEDSQAHDGSQLLRQDLNVRTLDLSLNLNGDGDGDGDGDSDTDSKTDQAKDGQMEGLNSSSFGT